MLGAPGAPHARTLRGGAEKAVSLPAPWYPPHCSGHHVQRAPGLRPGPTLPRAPSPHCTDEETESRGHRPGWHGSKPAAGRRSVRAWWKMHRLRISVSVQLLATPVLGKWPQMSQRACIPTKLYVQKQAGDQVRSSRVCRLCSKQFTSLNPCHRHQRPGQWQCRFPHFPDERTKAQRGSVRAQGHPPESKGGSPGWEGADGDRPALGARQRPAEPGGGGSHGRNRGQAAHSATTQNSVAGRSARVHPPPGSGDKTVCRKKFPRKIRRRNADVVSAAWAPNCPPREGCPGGHGAVGA